MICNIFIRMDNDAFGETPDEHANALSGVLQRIVFRCLRQGLDVGDKITAFDPNGNECGQLVIEDD